MGSMHIVIEQNTNPSTYHIGAYIALVYNTSKVEAPGDNGFLVTTRVTERPMEFVAQMTAIGLRTNTLVTFEDNTGE